MPQLNRKHDVFQALADQTRRNILKLLADMDLNISTITKHFPVTRTNISKHLRLLLEAELVSSRKEGRNVIYSLEPEPLKEVYDWVSYYEQFWKTKLQNLKFIAENEINDKDRL